MNGPENANPPSLALRGRTVAVCVTGSIAAFKAPTVVRLLRQHGARVRALMTESGARFLGESTLAGLCEEPVQTTMFGGGAGEPHVTLARLSDAIVVAPATADAIARAAHGRANDLVSATLLCATCPILLAPAMHPTMWSNPATQANVAVLAARPQYRFVGPVHGEVASGDSGVGRMSEPEEILRAVVGTLALKDLEGRHVVISAGPTVEDLDPVRFVSNRSTGKMGFALAERAAIRGARVTLVSGPVQLPTPPGVSRLDVRSAREMQSSLDDALGPALDAADALIMSAAVGDYRPRDARATKLKRSSATLTLELVPNPDIIATLGARRGRATRPALVAFAVETGSDAEIADCARGKLLKKSADLVVANHAAESFGRDDNRVTLVTHDGIEALPVLPKLAVADRILDWLVARLGDAE